MPRTLNRLGNAKQVAALKEAGWHGDGGGLYLRIQPGGGRSWVLVKVSGGKRSERGLGSAATITLARAREMRDNPPTEAVLAAEAPTFAKWADDFVDGLRDGWKNPKHRQQWENTLKTHAKPIRAMRVDEITTDDVLDVLRPIWSKTNETATRLRGRIERILDAARAKGHIRPPYENPARWRGHLEHFLPAKRKAEKGHHAAVPWRDMPAFWADLAKRRNSSSVEALRATILCATRTGETIGAQRCEVDLKRKIWTIPKERTKTGLEHAVALSDAAVAVFARMCDNIGPLAYVFPSPINLKKPLSNMAMLMLLQDDMGRDETVHGFRSSFRDWAGDATKFPRELAEQALAHVIGDKAEQAYRRGTAIEKRRPLMQAWADYLESASMRSAKSSCGRGSSALPRSSAKSRAAPYASK